MKAIKYTTYGSSEVLKLLDVQKPEPNENEILVKVKSVSINPYEWHHMRGKPFFSRLSIGLFKPKHPILGNDFSGIVASVGSNVVHFKEGDEVFGSSNYGALAEYVSVSEEKLLLKPISVSFDEICTLPIAGVTALQSLKDYGNIQSGQKVLINGASGGVGTFAVQIAKSYGAEVTAICSQSNRTLVESIGADHFMDYTSTDIPNCGKQYDLILDAVGNLTVADFQILLNKKGRGVVAGFTSMSQIFQVVFTGKWAKKKVVLMSTKIERKDLLFLSSLVEMGKLIPVLDRIYSLAQTSEAIEYLEKGHAKGKVVINMLGD